MARKKQKKTTQKELVQKIEEQAILPSHNSWLLGGALCIAYLINFIFYLLTLAPTVTFEDSGELITAAFNLGIPHPPGYPLFTLLGRFFTLLPFGTIAYRVNLMSAFFTAAAGVFVCWTTILLIENTFMQSGFIKKMPYRIIEILTLSMGVCTAVLFGTARTTWEQAVITEVYGLNSFFMAIFLFLAIWFMRMSDLSGKKKVLLLMSYISGLALTNHTTSLMFVPLVGIFILIFGKKLLLNRKVLFKSIIFYILGLTPYIYLPIASAKNPVLDWGNPENLTNFINVITRQQYNDGTKQTLEGFIAQFGFFCSDLLIKQWMPLVLLFAAAGLFFLFQKNRSVFYFVLCVLFFAMPVTIWMTNIDIASPTEGIENKAVVTVFYIPAYLVTAILIGIGLFRLITCFNIKIRLYAWLTGISLILLSGGLAIARTMPEVTMRRHTFARDYCDNVFNLMPEDALYFVDMDPFYFPTMYYQFVEKKRPDLIIFNQNMLRRSWYINWIRNFYPEFAKLSDREINLFLKAVAPFENRESYDGEYIEKCYISMINAFIDSKLKINHSVYFSYVPEANIMRSNLLDPQLVAYKYTKGPPDITINDERMTLSSFKNNNIRKDRMAECVSYYYGNLFTYHGFSLESLGDTVKAYDYFRKALPLFNPKSKNAQYIAKRLSLKKSGGK